jgi:hypothetical protein
MPITCAPIEAPINRAVVRHEVVAVGELDDLRVEERARRAGRDDHVADLDVVRIVAAPLRRKS